MKWSFVFKHWLLTILVAPVLCVVVMRFTRGLWGGTIVFDFMEMLLLYSLIFSIPVFLVCLLVFSILKNGERRAVTNKIVLIATAVLGMVITISLSSEDIADEIVIPYIVATICFGAILNLYPKEHTPDNSQIH